MKPVYKAFFMAEETNRSTRYMAEFDIMKGDASLRLRYTSDTIKNLVNSIQDELPIVILGLGKGRIRASALEGMIKITNLDGYSTLRPLTGKETAYLRKQFRKAGVKSHLKRI